MATLVQYIRNLYTSQVVTTTKLDRTERIFFAMIIELMSGKRKDL